MERILVGIDATHPSRESLIRALCLAQRMRARVSVLAVFAPGAANGIKSPQGLALRRGIEAELESAKALGVNVELFVAEGRFDLEMIRAARELKTTLLVASAATDERGGERETESLGRILSGVDCRVELVSPKKHDESTKEGT